MISASYYKFQTYYILISGLWPKTVYGKWAAARNKTTLGLLGHDTSPPYTSPNILIFIKVSSCLWCVSQKEKKEKRRTRIFADSNILANQKHKKKWGVNVATPRLEPTTSQYCQQDGVYTAKPMTCFEIDLKGWPKFAMAKQAVSSHIYNDNIKDLSTRQIILE